MTTTAQRAIPNIKPGSSAKMLKNLIIHTTDVARTEEFERALRRSAEFVTSYDGWEKTCSRSGATLSHRFYCYKLSNPKMLKILTHLHKVGKTGGFHYKIKINPDANGNHNFD